MCVWTFGNTVSTFHPSRIWLQRPLFCLKEGEGGDFCETDAFIWCSGVGRRGSQLGLSFLSLPMKQEGRDNRDLIAWFFIFSSWEVYVLIHHTILFLFDDCILRIHNSDLIVMQRFHIIYNATRFRSADTFKHHVRAFFIYI